MGIIEDQRNQMHAEIRAAQQSARRAEREAESQRAIYKWSKNNTSWSCEANRQLMCEYLAQAGIQVSADSLDLALRALRNNLAERPVIQEAPELTPEQKIQAENQR